MTMKMRELREEIRGMIDSLDDHVTIEDVHTKLNGLLNELPETSSMWINAFTIVRPTDETLLAIGRDVVSSLKIPGQTVLEVSAT